MSAVNDLFEKYVKGTIQQAIVTLETILLANLTLAASYRLPRQKEKVFKKLQIVLELEGRQPFIVSMFVTGCPDYLCPRSRADYFCVSAPINL